MLRKAALVSLFLLLAACAGNYALVDIGRKTTEAGYSVETGIAWNGTDSLGGELWTVDGPLLQSIYFSPGIADGKPLFELPRGEDDVEMPVFRSGQQPSEIVELIVDSLARIGAQQIETRNARPAKFGGADGVRFAFSYLSEAGLEREGIAASAVVDDLLYVIIYSGAKTHYFPKYRDEVERLIDSIEL